MKREKPITMADFPFPVSTDFEIQVISDLIVSPEMLMDARRIVKREMFSDEGCKFAWDTLCSRNDEHKAMDLKSLLSILGKDLMDRIGDHISGSGGLLDCLSHCSILAEKSVRQKVYQYGIKMLQGASCNITTLDDLFALPGNLESEIRAYLNADADSIHVSQAIDELAESIEEAQKAKRQGKATRVPTGFRNLDMITYGGFNAGQLIIVAARPSVGKTAVMLQMARAAATNVPTTVFSLEMTNQELAQRLMLSTGKVTPMQIAASGEMQWTEYDDAAEQFRAKPLFLNDSARTIDEICSKIILNHQQNRCGIAFIDYLGLIDTRTEGRTPLYQIIAGITRRLKLVAKDCRIPVVLLCQLNRASASENRPPALYDLRDSGSIEQDADIVIMLERPSTDETKLNMWIRKNRQGKAGDLYIELTPDSTYTNFSENGVKRV